MSEPVLLSLNNAHPAADFIPRLSALVEAMITEEGWSFGCETMAFTAKDVAAPSRLLPLVLNRSTTWMRESMGAVAPMDYRLTLDPLPGEENPPLCTAVPEASRPTASLVTWALYIRHALGEWVSRHPQCVANHEPVPLDEWYSDWVQDMDSGAVLLLSALPRVAVPRSAVPRSPLDVAAQPVQPQLSSNRGH